MGTSDVLKDLQRSAIASRRQFRTIRSLLQLLTKVGTSDTYTLAADLFPANVSKRDPPSILWITAEIHVPNIDSVPKEDRLCPLPIRCVDRRRVSRIHERIKKEGYERATRGWLTTSRMFDWVRSWVPDLKLLMFFLPNASTLSPSVFLNAVNSAGGSKAAVGYVATRNGEDRLFLGDSDSRLRNWPADKVPRLEGPGDLSVYPFLKWLNQIPEVALFVVAEPNRDQDARLYAAFTVAALHSDILSFYDVSAQFQDKTLQSTIDASVRPPKKKPVLTEPSTTYELSFTTGELRVRIKPNRGPGSVVTLMLGPHNDFMVALIVSNRAGLALNYSGMKGIPSLKNFQTEPRIKNFVAGFRRTLKRDWGINSHKLIKTVPKVGWRLASTVRIVGFSNVRAYQAKAQEDFPDPDSPVPPPTRGRGRRAQT